MSFLKRLRELRRAWRWVLVAVVMWCMLWGEVSFKSVLGGILAAGIVFVLFPMPPTGHELTIRPLRFITFLARFLLDLVRSAIEVGWFAVRPGPQPPGSVVGVKMASRSDFFLTFTGMLCTLIPGSVVVEAQRATGMLYLHAFNAGSEEDVEEVRRSVRAQEERLLWAIGRREVLKEAGLI